MYPLRLDLCSIYYRVLRQNIFLFHFVPFREMQHTLNVSHSRPNYKHVKVIDCYLIFFLLFLFVFFLISIYDLSEWNSDQANELFAIILVITFKDRKFTFLERKKIKGLG